MLIIVGNNSGQQQVLQELSWSSKEDLCIWPCESYHCPRSFAAPVVQRGSSGWWWHGGYKNTITTETTGRGGRNARSGSSCPTLETYWLSPLSWTEWCMKWRRTGWGISRHSYTWINKCWFVDMGVLIYMACGCIILVALPLDYGSRRQGYGQWNSRISQLFTNYPSLSLWMSL